MYYGNDYEITKNFLGTQMLLKENGKVILKAGRIVEYALDVDDGVKEEDHIYVTSNKVGVFDVYHAEQRRYLLTNAHFTADNFCEESGTPIVFTKDDANYYISPEGIVHDLRLDKCDVYFSQDSRGVPNHQLVFRIIAGLPEVLYREPNYNPAQNFGDEDYRTSRMLSRLPQGDHVDNPFIPLLIDNNQDLASFVWELKQSEGYLRTLADQYVRLTEGKFFNQADYLRQVAKHFNAVATHNGNTSIESLTKQIESNNQADADFDKSCEPKRAEMARLNQQINAINKALGQPEYDFDPDWEFFGKTAPYEVVPDNLAEMPQEVQDAYAERKQLMKQHQEIYFDLDVPEVDHSMETYRLSRRVDCIEFCATIEALADKIEQEQKILTATQPASTAPSTQTPTQTTTPTATSTASEMSTTNLSSQNNNNPTE